MRSSTAASLLDSDLSSTITGMRAPPHTQMFVHAHALHCWVPTVLQALGVMLPLRARTEGLLCMPLHLYACICVCVCCMQVDWSRGVTGSSWSGPVEQLVDIVHL